jgi:hypothetical protein
MADIWFDVDTALSEVPVNRFPLTDDTDFKTPEGSVAYNAPGMDLVWNFVTTAGAYTQTAVTPTTGGAYDWAHQGKAMYSIEIPSSGGASINNDTEGFGWFTGKATGVMPWTSFVYGFRAAGINNKLIDDAYDTERGLAGTALPAAAADAAGGLPISDAGALDLDTLLSTLTNGTYGLSAIETLVDELESRLTATRAGYLDNLSGGAVALASVCTEARLAELAAANIPADIDTLIARLTALRAGYLDNLSAGAVALASGVTVTTNNDKTGYTASTVSDKTGYSLAVTPPTASDIATAVWAAGTRTLSSFGSLVADIATAVWGAVSRTITGGTITTNSDKTGYALTGTDIADIKAVTVKLDTAMELDGAVYRFTTNALEEAPSSSGGDATAANQTIIINHLTDVKGATFSGATDSLEAIRNRGDVAWITGGTGGGSNTVTINVKASAVNVVDCYVEVWDSAGTSFISRTTTNSSGNVSFDLDNGTYTVKIHKAGYYFSNQTLTVDGAESVAYTGTILTPTAPTDPTLCKVYGYYFDPSGNTFPAIKSMVKMSVAYEAADNNYFVESINGTYNTTTGELSFNIVQGADAILDIPFLNIKKRFTVPAETLYKISDII